MSKDPLYFDQNAAIYDASRPDYPLKTYEIIAQNLDKDSYDNWLEIGAGNGAASGQILDELKPRKLVLLEPGENFIEILERKLAEFDNVEIIQGTFEDFKFDEKFDAILAATAWHWLDTKTKYSRVAELLKPDGRLIIFRNYFDLADEQLKAKIDELYAKYDNQPAAGDLRKKQLKRIAAARAEVRNSKLFEIDHGDTTEWTKMVDAETYINLRKSFQDNAQFGEQFFDEMRNLIVADEVEERILTDLIIARKVNI